MVKYVDVIKRLVQNSDKSTYFLDAAVQGIGNQSGVLNDKLNDITQALANQARFGNQKLAELVQGLGNQSQLLNENLKILIANQQQQLELQRSQTMALERLISIISSTTNP